MILQEPSKKRAETTQEEPIRPDLLHEIRRDLGKFSNSRRLRTLLNRSCCCDWPVAPGEDGHADGRRLRPLSVEEGGVCLRQELQTSKKGVALVVN